MGYKAILLFGAPGSGKGTQGKILGSIPGFYHNATGDIFRSLDLQSEMGRVFWEYAGRGQLVPDEITIRLWKQYIKGMEMINQFHPETEILVLDGIPRNVTQARLLEDTINVQKIIYLRCADLSKMVERLRRRALKENRFDDANDEVIHRRLVEYEAKTRPVLDFYPKDVVEPVDATMSQIRVLSDILKVLVPIKEQHDELHVPIAPMKQPSTMQIATEAAATSQATPAPVPATPITPIKPLPSQPQPPTANTYLRAIIAAAIGGSVGGLCFSIVSAKTLPTWLVCGLVVGLVLVVAIGSMLRPSSGE